MCLCLQSLRSGIINYQWNYLNILYDSSYTPYLKERYPIFFELNRLTYSFEKELQNLELDDKEIGLMLTLLITSVG